LDSLKVFCQKLLKYKFKIMKDLEIKSKLSLQTFMHWTTHSHMWHNEIPFNETLINCRKTQKNSKKLSII
jgi:hypothetical protein